MGRQSMASVVQGTSNGEYDLNRGLRLYDTSGDLPARARELCAQVGSDGIEMAREFLRRYARSLTFVHPLTQEPTTLTADLPKDFRTALTALEKWAG